MKKTTKLHYFTWLALLCVTIVHVYIFYICGSKSTAPRTSLSKHGNPKQFANIYNASADKKNISTVDAKTQIKQTDTKKRFVITLPYQDFYHWFSHWQRDIFGTVAIQACSHKCTLEYDQTEKADAVLFIMKPHVEYQVLNKVILNVEPYGFIDEDTLSYATYHPHAKYQVSYALSETTVQFNNIAFSKLSWHTLFYNSPSHSKKNALAAAWVKKTCDRHNNFLSRLMNTIPMDMYGECFNNKNEELEYPQLRDSTRGERKIKIGSDYKFYISLENSIIPHYVTEKFYQGFLQDSVMVYLGAPNIKEYEPLENSFIDASKFDSPESVGKYLLYLDQNPIEYQKHLSWKGKFKHDVNLQPLPGFLQAVNNSFERLDERSLLCRICDSL